jgi:predicted HicB family RNase H-like nuclease
MQKFTSLPIRKETHQAIKVMAAKNDMSMYELIDRFVEKGEELISK